MAARKKSTSQATGGRPQASLRFSRVNLLLGVAGLLALALGYLLLANGSITAAPLLLVLGYVVLVPLALIL
jgi:hypothetical protein